MVEEDAFRSVVQGEVEPCDEVEAEADEDEHQDLLEDVFEDAVNQRIVPLFNPAEGNDGDSEDFTFSTNAALRETTNSSKRPHDTRGNKLKFLETLCGENFSICSIATSDSDFDGPRSKSKLSNNKKSKSKNKSKKEEALKTPMFVAITNLLLLEELLSPKIERDICSI